MATTSKPATSKPKTTGSKPKKQRNAKSAAELKAKFEKAKLALAALEQRAYAGELEEAVKKTDIVSAFNTIKKSVVGANDLAILAAIGKAVGIARVEVTQKTAVKRAAKTSK